MAVFVRTKLRLLSEFADLVVVCHFLRKFPCALGVHVADSLTAIEWQVAIGAVRNCEFNVCPAIFVELYELCGHA